jgi:2-polyprenyl-3-methyl-5-hydroxy-6-metoxy-1,4-benzoquinol methylase
MTPSCTICTTPSPHLLTKDGYDLYCCPTCGLVFVYPLPKQEFLTEKVYSYESGYQSNKKGDFKDKPTDIKTKRIFDILDELEKEGNLLDVGCSSGEFMHYAELEGFTTYGVELNRRTAEVARAQGLNVFNGFLEDAKYESDFFDVIFLGDVIEHVTSPRNLIKECTRVLKRGGIMVISTPNLDCPWAATTFKLNQLFKIPWSSVTPPYHLSQFSYGNLYRLMREYRYSVTDKFFLRPPRLMYELGSLHLIKKWKQSKKIKDLFFAIFAFALYAICYAFDALITPLKSKDFSMVVFYEKK